MRVHLIKKQTLEHFAYVHPSSKTPLSDWIAKIKFADWGKPIDIKGTFNTADILGKGGKY